MQFQSQEYCFSNSVNALLKDFCCAHHRGIGEEVAVALNSEWKGTMSKSFTINSNSTNPKLTLLRPSLQFPSANLEKRKMETFK